MDEGERIVAEATRLFLTLGAAGFTMDRLAAELRMSKKTLYRSFRSKTVLLIAVLDGMAADVQPRVDEIVADRDEPPAKRFQQLVGLLAAQMSVLGPPQVELVRRDPELWAHTTAVRERLIFTPLRTVLAEAAEDRLFREGLDRELVTQLVPAAIEALAQSGVVLDADVTVGRAFEQLALALSSGIFVEYS